MKQLILFFVLIFVLSPCTVKQNLFSFIDVEYSKPLNKTKTTQVNSCISTTLNSKENLLSNETDKNLSVKLFDCSFSFYTGGKSEKRIKSSPVSIISNQLPYYILFNQMKISFL